MSSRVTTVVRPLQKAAAMTSAVERVVGGDATIPAVFTQALELDGLL